MNSTINRFLSRREKDGSHKRDKSQDKSKTRPSSSASESLLSVFKSDPQKKQDKELHNKIQIIKQRLADQGHITVEEEHIVYGLNSKHANGDVDKAVEILLVFQESVNMVIRPYNPDIRLLGAVNRDNVTCWLDSLLFAMFVRLENFEPILYNTSFTDSKKQDLATMVRLWVNMLRSGMLIQTDVTKELQDALVNCGWKEAGNGDQQDVSEAFNIITDTLEVPLLTLRMDIFHNGTEVPSDDHKFIHERLLEVAIPDEPSVNGRPVQLEDCLETFFNNRVEVFRRMEGLGRSNTITSVRSTQSQDAKGSAQHVEISEVPGFTSISTPGTPVGDIIGRTRTPSIIRHRIIESDSSEDIKEEVRPLSPTPSHASMRKTSVRKEVLMSAWQFFNLIPWYTHLKPKTDEEVAAHFSKTQPVIGVCLKRYSFTSEGKAIRKDTFVDIPLEIRLPHFVENDTIQEDGPLMGNFKLSLQSVICHRGTSVQSGHYLTFVRGTSKPADGDADSIFRTGDASAPPEYPNDRWIKFDDLAASRVEYVDIEKALKDEMPYLLFYQVRPTYEIGAPPSYCVDATVEVQLPSTSPVRCCHPDINGESPPFIGLSSDIARPRRSINLAELTEGSRRDSVAATEGSVAVTEGSVTSVASIPEIISSPPSPDEDESTPQRTSRTFFKRAGSKSRPSSSSGENRIGGALQRSWMRARDKGDVARDIPQTDGSSDDRDTVTATDDVTDASGDGEGIPIPGTSFRYMRGRKRDKSKAPKGKEVGHADDEPMTVHRLLGRKSSKDPDIDRECKIM